MRARGWLVVLLLAGAGGCSWDMQLDFSDCESDDECPSSQICRGGLLGNSCGDQSCSEDADCSFPQLCSLRDETRVTVTRKSCGPRECTCDADCPAGAMCEGECVRALPACQSDTDCEPGQQCREHNTQECNPENQLVCQGHPCWGCDIDCPNHQVCDGSSCTDARLCETDGDCASGELCGLPERFRCVDPARMRKRCLAPAAESGS